MDSLGNEIPKGRVVRLLNLAGGALSLVFHTSPFGSLSTLGNNRFGRGLGKGEEKRGTLAYLRLDPHAAAVPFDNLLTDGQSDAGAGIVFLAVKPLEDTKNLILELLGDSNPIIL